LKHGGQESTKTEGEELEKKIPEKGKKWKNSQNGPGNPYKGKEIFLQGPSKKKREKPENERKLTSVGGSLHVGRSRVLVTPGRCQQQKKMECRGRNKEISPPRCHHKLFGRGFGKKEGRGGRHGGMGMGRPTHGKKFLSLVRKKPQ